MSKGGPEKKLILLPEPTEQKEIDQKKFEDINTRIKNQPDQLEKVSKDSFTFLKEYLATNKDSAAEMLYNTLKALKNTENLEKDDKKSLENIRDMILNEENIMIDVGAYQLKTEVFNDKFDLAALKKYGETFNTGDSLTWFGNITDTYTKGKFPNFDNLFVTGEFKDAYFTPAQFQSELSTKNEERMTALVADLKALDIVTFLNDNSVNVASLDKITDNSKLTLILESKFPTMIHGRYEFNYLLEQNPDIMTTWTKAVSAKKTAETEILNKKTLETLTTDFTANKVLEKYLANNNNVKDSIYLYNQGTKSKLKDIIELLNTAITTDPSNTRVTNLITYLKAGNFKDFQSTIYNNEKTFSTTYVNPDLDDSKIGEKTYKGVESFLKYGEGVIIASIDDLPGKEKSYKREDSKIYTMNLSDGGYYVFYKNGRVKVSDKNGNFEMKNTSDLVNPTPTEAIITTTETTSNAAEIKKTLAAFDVSKVTITLYSGVKASDYKTLFTAVATTGTDTQIIAANAYMTALTTGKDPTLNGTNTDSQPGILTFQTICTALGQKDIYTTVKARIDKELAAAKTEKEAEAKATPVEKKETVETSQANPNTKKNNTFGSGGGLGAPLPSTNESFQSTLNTVKQNAEDGTITGIGKDKNIYPFVFKGAKFIYNSKTGGYAPMP